MKYMTVKIIYVIYVVICTPIISVRNRNVGITVDTYYLGSCLTKN